MAACPEWLGEYSLTLAQSSSPLAMRGALWLHMAENDLATPLVTAFRAFAIPTSNCAFRFRPGGKPP